MVSSASMILCDLSNDYSAPKNKLLALEKKGLYHKIVRGIYETEANVSPLLLAGSVYGPSYVSFEYALSFWSLIPEKVFAVTSATTGKNRTKRFETSFGIFLYRDVPQKCFPFETYIKKIDGRNFLIAGREKAICDILYREKPLYSVKRLKEFLFENFRIEKSDFFSLDFNVISDLSKLYKSTNVNLLASFVEDR